MNKNKAVLITGGASGIGLVIARRMLADGYDVHVCDASPDAVSSLEKSDPQIGATVADIADVDAVANLFREIQLQYGGLDVLVNNAGIAGPTAAIEAIDPVEWERTIAVDLNGHFYCTRLAVPMLKKSAGGSIINIASNAAFFGFPLRAPYTACKWATIGLTKTLAMELGPFRIRVNAICPGSVSGPRIDGVIERDAAERGMTPEQIREVYLRQSSMRIFVSAEDVANLAAFLASDAGASISGQALGLDGHTEGLTNWLDK
jgi:NAD(P)-dependent dehydrogenase (short-subunit alcohol dehydrogenase family)